MNSIALYLPVLLKGVWLTLQISILGIMAGLTIGLIIGIFQTHQKVPTLLKWLCKTYISIIRGTPLFVQLLIIYFGVPEVFHIEFSAFQAGFIALSINSGAYVAEIVRAGLGSVNKGQWEAARALGYTDFQTLKSIILPQAIVTMLPALGNELISLIKESSILMVLGVPELTKVSKELAASELKPMEIYLLTAVLYYVLTSFISVFVKFFERRSYAVKSV